ncbi:extracellular solute-binding protein [Candidatus Peregrinibacteria bacterium]|nr:extracellular solute-binding protein [Candidatus Peregrinibacteria bacterium]
MLQTKTSKIISVFLLVIAPLTLGGCFKTKCPKPADNIPGTSEFRDDCPYEDPNAAPTGTRELDFYFVYDNTDAFREQIQAYQSQNPGLIIRMKKFVDLAEYEDLVINEIAEGDGPDVFMVHNSWMLKHWKKLLPQPLDLPIVITPDVFRQTFFQAAADDLIINEEVYGMPLSVDNLAIYYNKAYFRDLLATTDQPGALWEDIRDQVFQLTKQNNSPERFALAGFGIGRGDNVARAVDMLYTLFLQYGVDFYNDTGEAATFANQQGARSGAVDFPGVEALEFYTSFGLPTYKNYSWNENITGFAPDEKEINPFVRGKVAMIVGYPYLYDTLVQAIQNQQKAGGDHIDADDIGVAPMPQLVTPTETTRRDTLASYFPLAVARTTDNPKDAWGLVQYLTTADSLQTYHKKTNHPTSRKDMVQEQQTEPIFGVFAYQAPFAKSFKIYDADAYYKAFTDAIQKVVTNVMTPKEALTEAQTKITCVIKKQKKLVGGEVDCGI